MTDTFTSTDTWAWERHYGWSGDGYERREACLTLIACPRCQAAVELVAETAAWTQGEDGRWQHTEYGPPVGEHCGLAFLDDPFTGVKAYRLPQETTP